MSCEKNFFPEAMNITREENKSNKEMKNMITLEHIKLLRITIGILNTPTAMVVKF